MKNESNTTAEHCFTFGSLYRESGWFPILIHPLSFIVSTNTSMFQRMVARAIEIQGNSPDKVEYHVFNSLSVLFEDFVYLGCRYRLDFAAGKQRAVIICDQGNVHDRDLLLQGQIRLRILCHADDFPALRRKPTAFRFRRKSRTVDSYDRAGLMDGYSVIADRLDCQFSQVRTIRI